MRAQEWIIKSLKQCGIGPSEVERRSGVTRNSQKLIRTGETSSPQPRTVKALAETFGQNFDDVMDYIAGRTNTFPASSLVPGNGKPLKLAKAEPDALAEIVSLLRAQASGKDFAELARQVGNALLVEAEIEAGRSNESAGNQSRQRAASPGRQQSRKPKE